jgi:hypothetical protein
MSGLRVVITTILGFIFGIVCMLLSSSKGPLAPAMAWSIIFNRTLMGFVIGISAWKINYLVHGILLGLFVTFPMALGVLVMPEKGTYVFWMTMFAGAVYGFLIELITHQIVKEKKPEPTPTSSA